MLPRRILIANRGEIAVRVIAACHELGIEAVAVYSAEDRSALHVRLADATVPIGGASSAESYLRSDRILEAARSSGAEAVHPGYGFLSERADFAAACSEAGLTFIGPPAAAMRLLGNKVAAKELAERAGVPTLPGYLGADRSPAAMERAADRLGYPVLIKAAAGGGGRGMRVVQAPEELAGALEAAAREAHGAFGDGTVFLERYLTRPRHVEVQVLADRHGGVVALGERECSVQRRHQKVIEEAPSPAVSADLRAALCESAVRLARAAGYVNAGTVEFLLDENGGFYFLEMNTRLQVEHPVTELVSGLDLVVAQIRIAAGEALPAGAQATALRGHAIEARLYAEDPAAGFLPAAGRVLRCELPHLPGVRIDSGVEAGDTVSMHYDPLLAKVIAHGQTREAALARLRGALARCQVLGLHTNLPYLRAIVAHPRFAAGALSTRFLEEYASELLAKPAPPEPLLWYAAALALVEATPPAGSRPTATAAWQMADGWRQGGAGRSLRLRCADETRHIHLLRLDDDLWIVHGAGEEGRLQAARREGGVAVGLHGRRLEVMTAVEGAAVYLGQGGWNLRFVLDVAPGATAVAGRGGHGEVGLQAPMPGTVARMYAREGQVVAAGEPLLVLEAMKMEHVISAPHAGVVRRLPFGEGTLVQAGAVLAELEEA